MHALGYRILVTVLLPGAMVAAAIWLILERFFPDTRMYEFLYFVVSKEWLGAVALLLGASLLGTFLGSIMGFAECWTFDRWDQRRMHLTREQYYTEWESYIDSLDKTENSYITQMSMYFQFESRSAIACALFGIAWCFYGWSLTEIVGGSLLVVLGYVLYVAAKSSHRELSNYRNRRWPSVLEPASSGADGAGSTI